MKPVEIFSNGGGTQSCAAIALIIQGKLPRPDYICIVDTERERSTTWQYLDAVIRPALRKIGVEVHRIRKSEWGSKPPHGMDYMSHNGNTLLLPSFTNQTGEVGKLSGFCSKTWKVETQQRYCREALGIPTNKQKNWICFSLDEARRASQMMGSKQYKAGLIRFPLIQGVPMRREQSIQVVLRMGWPEPPRSACWMCPNQLNDEWASLTPEEFQAACELEIEMQKQDPFAWFHKSCVPLSQIDFSKPMQPVDDLFSRACSSGGCFT